MAAPKHGFQTVGKIGLARRVPPAASTLKHSNSSSASLNSIQTNTPNTDTSSSSAGTNTTVVDKQNSAQVGWSKLDSENNSTRNNSIEYGDDVLSLDIPDKDYTESGPSSLSDPIQDTDTLSSSGCKQTQQQLPSSSSSASLRQTSNQLDSPRLREKEAKDSSPRENGQHHHHHPQHTQQQQSPVVGQNSGGDSKIMEISQSDGSTTAHQGKFRHIMIFYYFVHKILMGFILFVCNRQQN